MGKSPTRPICDWPACICGTTFSWFLPMNTAGRPTLGRSARSSTKSCIPPMYLAGETFAAYAEPIRRAAKVPTIASGTIHDPAEANRLIADDEADSLQDAFEDAAAKVGRRGPRPGLSASPLESRHICHSHRFDAQH
jgi:hypothetical protein